MGKAGGSGIEIDKAKRAPELVSYLYQVLDESSRKGRLILTGPNNFLFQGTIGDLFGDTCRDILLPCSFHSQGLFIFICPHSGKPGSSI